MPKPNKPLASLLLAHLWAIGPLLLAGCDKPDNAPGPGEVSMGEARALDRAAEIIEERAVEVPEPDDAPREEPQVAPLQVESTAPAIADEPAD